MTMRMNENLQLMRVRGGKGLQDKTETLDKGGTQESVGVTLAVTHCTGDIEHELATFCIQTGTPAE